MKTKERMLAEVRIETILRESPLVMEFLFTARTLNFPQWRLASGAVYQTVWNALTGRPASHGIHDFDLLYFDDSDLSRAQEERFMRRSAEAFSPHLAPRVEVCNQARVHQWFEGYFGEPYAPLHSTDEAFRRFVAPALAVGVRLEEDGQFDFVAPFGFDDVLEMRLRPNPARPLARAWRKTVQGLFERWPELRVVEPESIEG